jgi:hypothetical protein
VVDPKWVATSAKRSECSVGRVVGIHSEASQLSPESRCGPHKDDKSQRGVVRRRRVALQPVLDVLPDEGEVIRDNRIFDSLVSSLLFFVTSDKSKLQCFK